VREVDQSSRSGTGIIPSSTTKGFEREESSQLSKTRSSSSSSSAVASTSMTSSKHVKWSNENDSFELNKANSDFHDHLGSSALMSGSSKSKGVRDHSLHLEQSHHDPDLDRGKRKREIE
jgi:hypothetical protein